MAAGAQPAGQPWKSLQAVCSVCEQPLQNGELGRTADWQELKIVACPLPAHPLTCGLCPGVRGLQVPLWRQRAAADPASPVVWVSALPAGLHSTAVPIFSLLSAHAGSCQP